MIITKTYYQKLNVLLENNVIEFEQELNKISNEVLYDFLNFYLKDEKEITKEFSNIKRIKRMIYKYVSNSLSYQIGVFSGITQAAEILIHYFFCVKDKKAKMESLWAEEINQKILYYIFEHPNCKYEEILNKVDISSDNFNYIMKKLVHIGAVVGYGSGRKKFYELTLFSKYFIENMVKKIK